MKIKPSIGHLGYIVVITVGAALAILVHHKADKDYQDVVGHYREVSYDRAELAAKSASNALNMIYQGIRTISQLPSVREIDRYGKNLSVDARESILQIYNNMNTNVAVSEIYIVPADLEPEQIDPVTGSLQSPILMFDTHATAMPEKDESEERITTIEQAEKEEEVEIFEYRLLKEQMAYLKQGYAHLEAGKEASLPFISSPEVPTCDNHQFEKTHLEADRNGVIFSVPFYGMDGSFKGMISAIVLTSALRNLIPEKDHALINTTHRYTAISRNIGQETKSSKWVSQFKADPNLLFSAVLPLESADPQSQWGLWVGHSDALFLNSEAAESITNFQTLGYGFSAGLTLLGLAFWGAVRHAGKKEVLKKSALEAQRRDAQNETADRFEFSIAGVMAHVTDAIQQMQTDIQQVANIAEDTQRRSGLVTLASNETRSNSAQVAAAIEELTSSIKDISNQTQKSSQVAAEAQARATKSKETIALLSQKSTKISEIIGAITGIAEKINLLALNATIESARAGEAGKGFAVVASEVKNLATLVAKATEEITKQINEVQSVTQTSVASVGDILAIIDQVSQGTATIATAVQQQSDVTGEIARSVLRSTEGMLGITENIASVQEGAEKTGTTAQTVLESAKNLKTRSDTLQQKVDEFLASIRSV